MRVQRNDGSYIYQKRTANGYVEISEDEWRRYCKTFDGASKKRPADDDAEESQRLKRTKSILPAPAKRDEVEVTAITLKDGKVTEDKKLKASYGTLHLTDDDGAKDLSPEKLKKKLKLLECYSKTITARGLELQKENDTLRKEISEDVKRANTLNILSADMDEKIEELQSTVEDLTNRSNTLEKEKDALEAKIKELNDTHAHNWKQLEKKDEQLDEHEKVGEWNDRQFKKLKEINRQLQQENTQLKAYLSRLNPQEL